MNEKDYRVIIFDFDGTIADSRKTLVDITNELAPEFGFDVVREEEVIRLSNLSSQDVLLQSPIPVYKIPFLLRRVKKELNKQIIKLKPFLGIKELLINLQTQGFCIGIVTSNMRNNVLDFLEKNQLGHYFDFVYSANTIFGKHKIIKKLINQYQLPLEKTFYVGDETRDIEAAKKSNIRIIAVTWGFNTARVLAKHQPDFLINKPSELSQLFN